MTRRVRAPGTLVGALREAAAGRGQKVAFRHGDVALTFGDLGRAAQWAADALASGGVRPGHVVAVGCADPIERIVAHCGVLAAGACALPLNPAYREELPPMLAAGEVRGLVADAPMVDRARAAARAQSLPLHRCWVVAGTSAEVESWHEARSTAPRAPEPRVSRGDAALLCFTSGTTGAPTGALHTHARCLHNLELLRRAWEWTAADVLYLPVVLFHAHGLQNGVHGTLLTGCTTILPDGPCDGASMLATLATERCSLLFGVPTHYRRLLEAADADAAAVRVVAEAARLFVSGSAPLPADTFERFRARFGHAICERYGMTETLMLTTNPLAGERRAGTVGLPLPGVALRVAADDAGTGAPPGVAGEVWVRGTSVIERYHARPGFAHPADAAAFHEGWFRTGDLGRWTDDGRLELLGRRDDLILSGGLNVRPAEVEDALLTHPGVSAAAVVGVPDPDLGQCVAAAVVAATTPPPVPAVLAAHVTTLLAPYKRPRRLQLMDALPTNAVGKLDRRALRLRLADAPRVDAPAPTG